MILKTDNLYIWLYKFIINSLLQLNFDGDLEDFLGLEN